MTNETRKNNPVFSVILPKDVFRELTQAAKTEGFSRALMARRLIIEGLKQRKEKP